MASSLGTKLRIAASVIFAAGFFDAIAGRFVFQPGAQSEAPPPPDNAPKKWRDLGGAVHVHSTYSDGAGDIPTVMAGACEAGVDWLLLADHNTQQPLRDGWEERFNERPLLLVGTEVTVEHGAFLLALDMPPEWEPVRDLKPQSVIDDINARGGLPLVSLPFDVKHPWRDWEATGFKGLEVINFSTVARRHINLFSLLWLLLVQKRHGILGALRALVARPDQALARWDNLLETGRGAQIGIGALDAHALMKIGSRKYPIPSYANSFRACLTHVRIPSDAPDTRRAIYDALRAGRCYFSYDILGDPRQIAFQATQGDETAEMGGEIGRGARLVAQAAPGTLLCLYHRGRVVASGQNGYLSYVTDKPGAYRVEAYHYGFRIGPIYANARSWIFTNPIYVR